ncbi:Isoleucine--tRNA ligase [bioreactor metagenome]|uniref:Isoleucine--tRNA ligase n=1 Tax=bioreactor metagenome TaxID=1076179 RepID=A0A645GT47_9ZZZZ
MLVSSKSLQEYYGDIIRDELNIKEVIFGADLSSYVNFDIKPNLPVLGKAYGRYIPVIRKELGAMNQMELAQKIQTGESIVIKANDIEIELNQDNLLVTMQGLEGFAFAGEGTMGVVLDTTLTEELREEGHLREILSKVQNMRKENNFEVSDKIILYVGGNEKLENVAKKFEDNIKKETLSIEIKYNENVQYVDTKINGEDFKLQVQVIK